MSVCTAVLSVIHCHCWSIENDFLDQRGDKHRLELELKNLKSQTA